MNQIKKESLTILFVAVIILGGMFHLELEANTELSKSNRQKNVRIHQLKNKVSVLELKGGIKSQTNLILRSHIKGRVERELLRDEEYTKLIVN
jgi:hypothetical protein